MRTTLLCAVVLTAGCAAGRGPAVAPNPWDDYDPDCESFSISMGDRPTLEIENGHGRFGVTQNAGRVAVTLDGDPLPEEQLQLEGNVLRVTDEAGATVLMIGAFGRARDGRKLFYSPDVDPASVNRRFGFGVEPLDEKTGRQTGLDPRRLAVFRGGRETEVGIRARDRATWPEPAEVEAYLGRILQD